MGGRGAPIICDFAPINYLLADKIPIYCLPLQYQFSDYLPDSDKWTIGQLDKYPITKRTALCAPMYNVTMCSYTIKWFLASGGRQPRVTSNARPQGNFWDLSEPDPPSISPVSMPASSILHVPNAGFNKDDALRHDASTTNFVVNNGPD